VTHDPAPLFSNTTTGDWPVILGAAVGAVLFRFSNQRMTSPTPAAGWRYLVASAVEALMISGTVYVLWVAAGGFPQRYDTGLRQGALSMVLSGLTGTGIFAFARIALFRFFPRFFPPPNGDLPSRKESP
jgi:hypothetical protein